MVKFDNCVKYKIVEVEGTTVPSISYDKYNPYIDFIIYSDSDGDVYKVDCNDHAVKYTIIKGQQVATHMPINFESNIVNMIILKDDIIRCGRTNYMTVINALRELNKLLNRNINLEEKVIEMGYKYGFSTTYKIIRNL